MKQFVLRLSALFGLGFNLTEMFCYFFFFGHIKQHNNTVAIHVLEPHVIHQRNRLNAIRYHKDPYDAYLSQLTPQAA